MIIAKKCFWHFFSRKIVFLIADQAKLSDRFMSSYFFRDEKSWLVLRYGLQEEKNCIYEYLTSYHVHKKLPPDKQSNPASLRNRWKVSLSTPFLQKGNRFPTFVCNSIKLVKNTATVFYRKIKFQLLVEGKIYQNKD